jgi:lipid-binding SYLF domain-containing protein
MLGLAALTSTGCSTAPKMEDRPAFISESQAATKWFTSNVTGLRAQMDDSAGYIIYPGVAQWGILISGGNWGRGMVNRGDDSQIGWASVNNGSLGLQAGVRGFKMLVVFEDQATLEQFKQNKLTGSVSGVAVAGEAGVNSKVSFTNGVAVYQGASTGLIAGINVGFDFMRFEPLDGGG